MMQPHEMDAIMEAVNSVIAQLQKEVALSAELHKRMEGHEASKDAYRHFINKEQQCYGALKVKEAVLNKLLEL